MAKNRMINTKFWSDGWVINLNSTERYLFLYLLTNEHTNICGIYELPTKIIARESGINEDEIKKMLKKLSEKVVYLEGWIYIKNFLKHQKSSGNVQLGIENGQKEVPPHILAKIKLIEDTPPSQVGHSPILELESELELEPKLEYKVGHFVPPTYEEVKQYCLSRPDNKVDSQKFVDFYASKGWLVGKNKMKDWQACVRTWEKSDSGAKKTNKDINYNPSKYDKFE